MAAAAARRAAPARAPRGGAATSRKAAPTLRAVPARKAPARRPARRATPARRPGGQLIPIAVGTATAVGRLPDSGLMVRMTRGRAWIGVLGVLLTGIVALNVITLSFAASAGRIDQSIQALEQGNSILRSRDAERSGTARVRRDAAALGLGLPTADKVVYLQATGQDVTIAARRLAAAGPHH
jgi:hypothetical protein